MINVTREQIKILKPHIPNVEELLDKDIQEFLDIIDDVIVDNILANNDEPDEDGIKLQRVYDQVYNQN